jgi:hypothetical protein
MAPASWRDVFDLVESSKKEVLGAIETHRLESRADHRDIDTRLRSLEDDRTKRSGAQAAEKRIFGMARSTVAMVVAMGGVVLSLLRS